MMEVSFETSAEDKEAEGTSWDKQELNDKSDRIKLMHQISEY